MGARAARVEKERSTKAPRQRRAQKDAASLPAQKSPRSATPSQPATARKTAACATEAKNTVKRLRAKAYDLPAVVLCADRAALQALSPEEARLHVDAYLHSAMPATEADDFEALSYRWELHLVPIEDLCLLRTVEVSRGKLRSYRAAIRRCAAFPPLVGLGGEGKNVTENVLLCDGYHRVKAMRELGIHFAWVWLAVGLWQEPVSSPLTALAASGV